MYRGKDEGDLRHFMRNMMRNIKYDLSINEIILLFPYHICKATADLIFM